MSSVSLKFIKSPQKIIIDEQHCIKSVIQSFNAFSAFSSIRTHRESLGGSKMWIK